MFSPSQPTIFETSLTVRPAKRGPGYVIEASAGVGLRRLKVWKREYVPQKDVAMTHGLLTLRDLCTTMIARGGFSAMASASSFTSVLPTGEDTSFTIQATLDDTGMPLRHALTDGLRLLHALA